VGAVLFQVRVYSTKWLLVYDVMVVSFIVCSGLAALGECATRVTVLCIKQSDIFCFSKVS